MLSSVVPPILCTGIVRSGSTWSFNVCRHLGQLLARQRGGPCTSGYAGEAELEQNMGVLTAAPGRGTVVLKAHALGPVAVSAVRAGRAVAVCTFRDPRDCVASDLTFLKKSFDDCVRRVSHNLTYLSHYRSSRHTLFVRYEDMMANPLRQVMRVAAHLGVDAGESDLRRIDAMTGPPAARSIAAGLRFRPPEQVLYSDARRVDPATHLHENHIHSGRVGRWRDELPADQQDLLTDVFHPWLVELGYETAGAVAYA